WVEIVQRVGWGDLKLAGRGFQHYCHRAILCHRLERVSSCLFPDEVSHKEMQAIQFGDRRVDVDADAPTIVGKLRFQHFVDRREEGMTRREQLSVGVVWVSQQFGFAEG